MKARLVLKGGPGSGNFGHAGRPGKVGGSSNGGSSSIVLGEKPPIGDLDSAWDEVIKWEKSRKGIARAALDDMMSRRGGYNGFIVRDAGGVSAVASYKVMDGVVHVNNFATRSGGGKGILAQFRAAAGMPLEFQATVQARSYYEHIGLELLDGTTNTYQYKGGPGSGHHGHAGRPGKVGGSGGGLGTVICPEGVRCTVATLQALGIETKPGKEYTFGTSVISGIQQAGLKWSLVDLPGNKRTTVKNFVAANPNGSYYISTRNHAMALVDGVLTDTEGKGLDGRVVSTAIKIITPGDVLKGGPGSGHHGHTGRPGKVGGSSSGGTGPNHLPPEQRVWQGKQVEGKVNFNQNETGRRGEVIAAKALQDKYGVEFSLLNDGLNNAPIDVAGDHHAIEVKTGPATNGYSAQQWRITTSYTSGPTERDLIAKMSKQERSAYNKYKQEQSISRKYEAVTKMSEMAGAEIKPATVGVVLSADGRRGDVYMIPDFHLRLSWSKYATDEFYLGTYEVGDESKEDVLKGGPGSGHFGHTGRPGKVGGSAASGMYTDAQFRELFNKYSYSNFNNASDKVKFFENFSKATSEAFGLPNDVKVIDSNSMTLHLNANASKSLAQVGASASQVRMYYYYGDDTVRIRKDIVTSLQTANDYRLAIQDMFHELGHVYDRHKGNNSAAGGYKNGYYGSEIEEFADLFSSRLAIAYGAVNGSTALRSARAIASGDISIPDYILRDLY